MFSTQHLARLALFVALLGTALHLKASEVEDPVLLVARPQLVDALYGATILLAKPMPDGSSVGFIINKPTNLKLGQLFPMHPPSLEVTDPIFLGGPVGTNLVFALVERNESPGEGSMKLAPGLFLAMQADTVDKIIEQEPQHARFLVGLVVWRPGELRDEMRRGMWYAMKADSDLILRKQTEGLWEELVQRSEIGANAI